MSAGGGGAGPTPGGASVASGRGIPLPAAAGVPSTGPGTSSHSPLIDIRNMVRSYQVGDDEVHALDDVTLTVRRGEFVALMGPSGSGKSTLLNILGCLDTPTSGTYLLDGQPVQSLSEDELADVRQKKISFIFQSYHLVPRMTAERNVELPMLFAGIEPKERKTRIRAALERVGLGHRLTHRPTQLSGGERQRVAIARALAMNPQILLADEPTGNLDSKSGGEIVALLKRLNGEGLTIVMVTHDPNVARQAQRVLQMMDGRLVGDEVGG